MVDIQQIQRRTLLYLEEENLLSAIVRRTIDDAIYSSSLALPDGGKEEAKAHGKISFG